MRQWPSIKKRYLVGLTALSGMLVLAVLVASHRAGAQPYAATQAEQRIALGQQLFNDAHLSADGTIRCASCHIPEKAYTDGRRVAIGVYGQAGTRNTPSLATIEVSKDESFFWDGRRTTLQQAVLDPLTNPVEMGLHDQAELIKKIERRADYRIAFAQAFPDSTNT